MTKKPFIAIPIPTLTDQEYNRKSWVAYARAVEQCGGGVIAIEPSMSEAEVLSIANTCDGILLPGSPADVNPEKYAQEPIPECAPADRAREAVDILLLEEAYRRGKPVLGICFGTQMLNVWRGGTLVQDLSVLPVNHAAGGAVAVAHSVSVAPDSMLGRLLVESEASSEAPLQTGFLRLPTNSSHHQALSIPGEGLRISARCSQDAVIEAVEGSEEGHFVMGVQWHPERSFAESAASRVIFESFVSEAAKWSEAGARN